MSHPDKHTVVYLSDLHILCVLRMTIRNANLWTSLVSTPLKCKAADQNMPASSYSVNPVVLLGGLSHLLFPLKSLEYLVKIGRYWKETVHLPVAQTPHCFHSCLVKQNV